MTQEAKVFDGIKQALLQQKANLQGMLGLLRKELEAVKKRDGEELLLVSKEKEGLLNDITHLDVQLSGESQAQFIKQAPELISIKDEITQLLQTCQQKNEVVYLTATQNHIAIEDVKRLLIGGSRNTTYDAHGQKKSGASLGKGIKA